MLINYYPLPWASLVAQMVKNLPTMKATWVQSLGMCRCCLVAQSCLTVCNSIDYSHQAFLSMGMDTGVGCHFLLQRIFLTQGWNPRVLHWQADSLPLSHLGSLIVLSEHWLWSRLPIGRSSVPLPLGRLGCGWHVAFQSEGWCGTPQIYIWRSRNESKVEVWGRGCPWWGHATHSQSFLNKSSVFLKAIGGEDGGSAHSGKYNTAVLCLCFGYNKKAIKCEMS